MNLSVEEESSIYDLMYILHDVVPIDSVLDHFVWWRNKNGFLVKVNYKVILKLACWCLAWIL